MGKLKEDFFEHFLVSDEVRKALNRVALDYSDHYRRIVQETYDNSELRSLYNAIREESSLGLHKKSKIHRQIIKFPNAYVLHFLNDIFTPIYGENWLKDKDTLYKVMRKEDLIKVWMTIKLPTLANRQRKKNENIGS